MRASGTEALEWGSMPTSETLSVIVSVPGAFLGLWTSTKQE